MLTTAPPASDAVARALAWAVARGVQVETLSSTYIDPDEEPADHPVLYLVAPGTAPPSSWGELEDWIRLPADSEEIYDRVERLAARAGDLGLATTWVDADDVLRMGSRLVPLSPMDAELVRVLLDQSGRIVTRRQLEVLLWPAGCPSDPRALDNRLKRLRRRLGGLPLRIHTVRGRGLLLERVGGPEQPRPAGADG